MARRPGEGSNSGPGAGTRSKPKPKPRQSRPVGVLAPGAGYSNGRATSPKPSKRVFSTAVPRLETPGAGRRRGAEKRQGRELAKLPGVKARLAPVAGPPRLSAAESARARRLWAQASPAERARATRAAGREEAARRRLILSRTARGATAAGLSAGDRIALASTGTAPGRALQQAGRVQGADARRQRILSGLLQANPTATPRALANVKLSGLSAGQRAEAESRGLARAARDTVRAGKADQKVGVGPASVNVTKLGRTLAAATTLDRGDLGPRQIVRNALGDVAALGTAPFIGGVQVAGALDSLRRGDTEQAGRRAGALASALYEGAKTSVPVLLAQGKFEEAGSAAKAHPVFAVLDAAAAAGIAGRTAGAVSRGAGSNVAASGLRGALARAGSPVRPPIALTSDAAAVRGGAYRQRSYSMDSIRKGVQVAKDRPREVLRDHRGRVVTVVERGRRVPVLRPTASEMARFGKKRANHEASRANAVERLVRAETLAAVNEATKATGVRGKLPGQRLGGRLKGETAQDLTHLVATGVIRGVDTFKEDLLRRADTIRREIDKGPDGSYRHSGERKAAIDTEKRLREAAADPKVLAQADGIVEVGLEFARRLNRGDAELIGRQVIDPRQAERSRLSEYALAHMDAKHFTVEEHRALENAARKKERGLLTVARGMDEGPAKQAALVEYRKALQERIAVSGKDPRLVVAHERAQALARVAKRDVKEQRGRVEQVQRKIAGFRKRDASQRMADRQAVLAGRMTMREALLRDAKRGKGGKARDGEMGALLDRLDREQAKLRALEKKNRDAQQVAQASRMPKAQAALRTADGRLLTDKMIREHAAGESAATDLLAARSSAERRATWDAMPDDADVWVFHYTDKATAERFAQEGVKLADKPMTLARRRYESGEAATFQPGAGFGHGLSVGVTPASLDGYGRVAVAVRVKKRDVVASPEQVNLGARTSGDAIAVNDAMLVRDAPAKNVVLIPATGRVADHAAIGDLLRARGAGRRDPATLAYVPHVSGGIGNRAYHQAFRPGTRPRLGADRRTGTMFQRGANAVGRDVVRDALVSKAVTVTKAQQLDRMISDSGIRHPAVAKAQAGGRLTRHEQRIVDRGGYFTAKEADELAKRLEGEGRGEYIAVRAHSARMTADELDRVQGVQGPAGMETAHLSMFNDRVVTEGMGKADSSRARNVVLMPVEEWNQLVKHAQPAGELEKVAQAMNAPFRMAVLPQMRWLAGNVIEPFFVRLPLSGAGINLPGAAMDFMAARKVLKTMERSADPRVRQAAREISAQQLGGLFIGNRGASVRRTAQDFAGRQGREGATRRERADLLMADPAAAAAFGAHVVRHLPIVKQEIDLAVGLAQGFFGVNRVIERFMQMQGLGKSIRQDVHAFTGSWFDTVRLGEKAAREAAEGLVNTATQQRYMEAQHVLLGKYEGFNPLGRRMIQTVTPFVPWSLAAARFVFWTMPAHHTVATAALLKLSQDVQADWDEAHKNAPPDLNLALVQDDGGLVDLARYSPYGFSGPLSQGNIAGITGTLLPQISGAQAALRGQDPFGRPLRLKPTEDNPEGTPSGWQKAGVALNAGLEASVPWLAMARRLQEGGGTPYGNSTVLSPKTKPDSSHMSAVRRTLDPFRPTYVKPKASGTPGSRPRRSGGASGGFKYGGTSKSQGGFKYGGGG